MSCSICGRGIDGFVFLRPSTNSHSPGIVLEWMMYPCFGALAPGGTRVTLAPSVIHGRCEESDVVNGMLDGVAVGSVSEMCSVMTSTMSFDSSLR